MLKYDPPPIPYVNVSKSVSLSDVLGDLEPNHDGYALELETVSDDGPLLCGQFYWGRECFLVLMT